MKARGSSLEELQVLGWAGLSAASSTVSTDTDIDGELRVVILCTKQMERRRG